MVSRISRSEKLLERAVASGGLTENGKAAVIAAMDPFHDMQIPHLRGWPDANTAPSVIRVVRQTHTFKALSTGDNVMIYLWPILNRNTTSRCSRRNNIIDTATASASTDFELGAVTVQHFSDIDNMTLTAGTHEWTSALDGDYLKDACRLIGCGIEVTDVTAELYKQGTLTAFQVPQSTVEPQTYHLLKAVDSLLEERTAARMEEFFAGKNRIAEQLQKPPNVRDVDVPTPLTGFPLKKYPTSMSEIMSLEGTRQWEAKDGCYVVAPFAGRDNFNGQPTYGVPLIYVDTLNAGERIDVAAPNTSPFNIGQWYRPSAGPAIFLANKFVPIDSKGILLSGLNENSTFTMNVVYYLESFPGPDDPALITLARPSCPLDHNALEIISLATQDLPIAVPVAMNGLGDWFAEVVAEVAPWIGAAGNALGVPLVGVAANAAAAAANEYMKSTSYKPTKSAQPSAPSPASQKPGKKARQNQKAGPAKSTVAKGKQKAKPAKKGGAK